MIDRKSFTRGQEDAVRCVESGKNTLLIGPGGVGKSAVVHYLRERLANRNVAYCSTTGVSALLLGGQTLHSCLGIGLGNGTVQTLYKKLFTNKPAMLRWQKMEILVIDEISMLTGQLFDKLEQLACLIRKTSIFEPFGGIQLVLLGDFLQLPPVNENEKFVFESDTWHKCEFETVYLDEIVRQKDKMFQTILNEIRLGKPSQKSLELLLSRKNVDLTNDAGIKPTIINTTNASVDYFNNSELSKLISEDNPCFQYDMTFIFHKKEKDKKRQDDLRDKYKKHCMAPECLQLCEGAQVMLLCNLDMEDGLANGSRGVVTSFTESEPPYPNVRFLNGKERTIDVHSWEIEEDDKKVLTISQLPLKLAWCVTVHKMQAVTLDYAKIDLSRVFAPGQVYVALSRVRTLEGLSIVDIDVSRIKAHPKALEFHYKLQSGKDKEEKEEKEEKETRGSKRQRLETETL
jgi:ATP-dependent DNA helicase PIF1